MNLEQKTFGRRNFLKGVIAGVSSLSLPLFSLAEEKKDYRIHVYTTDGNNDSVNKRIAQLRKYIKEFSELDPDNFRIEKLETKIESFYTNPDEITIIDKTGKIRNLVIGFKEPKKTVVYYGGKPLENLPHSYIHINEDDNTIKIGSTETSDSPDVCFFKDNKSYGFQSRNGGYIVIDGNRDDKFLIDFTGDFTKYQENYGKYGRSISTFKSDKGRISIDVSGHFH